MKILKNLLLASMTVLAFSCSSDDDGSSNSVSDSLGFRIVMEWDTQSDLFELDIDNADGTNFDGSSSGGEGEILSITSIEDGTYFLQVEEYGFVGSDITSEEVTFTIYGISDINTDGTVDEDDTLTFTVDVANILENEEISVIELTVDGDEYSFDQIEDSI